MSDDAIQGLRTAMHCLYLEVPGSVGDDVKARGEAVIAELHAARRDVERLDWILKLLSKEELHIVKNFSRGTYLNQMTYKNGEAWGRVCLGQGPPGDDGRAAIDAAMKETT